MTAPRLTVKAHVPWHWRVLATVLLTVAAVGLAAWTYDIGRRYAGYDKTVASQELDDLRERVAMLEAEADKLRGIGNASEASLQIERTAQQRLSEQIKRLEGENARLREDLAAFENLASGETRNQTASIQNLQVEADPAVAGAYRYRFLAGTPGGRTDREFKGRLQLVATVLQEGKVLTLNIPDASVTDLTKFTISFKYFRRIEGNFTIPAKAVLKKLEVRLMQGVTVVNSQQVEM